MVPLRNCSRAADGGIVYTTVLLSSIMSTNTFSIGVRILSPPSSAADKRRRLRMFRAMGAAVVAIILLIVVIGVYVSSSGGRCLAPSGICTSTPTRRQVFILRHCVRSTTTVVKYGVPHVTNASAYTNISLPAWGVPDEWCTPGGLALLEGTGAYLVSSGAVPAHTSSLWSPTRCSATWTRRTR